ncbi:MAG: helix-turn-helix domain-containing protein [Solobacterium sp.]|nr:helix-turn-helix domain-containing protein [Solobacterium sp.]
MELQKIGGFLKELRNEQEMTQEQLAEKLNVSRRTVSRWETGNNMPDLDLLIELADLYKVDLRELLNGERKGGNMDKEMEETVLQVAEYSNAEKQRSAKIVTVYFVVGIIALFVNAIVNFMELGDTFWIGFVKGSTFGLALGAMLLGLLYITGRMEKMRAFKMRLIGKEQK